PTQYVSGRVVGTSSTLVVAASGPFFLTDLDADAGATNSSALFVVDKTDCAGMSRGYSMSVVSLTHIHGARIYVGPNKTLCAGTSLGPGFNWAGFRPYGGP